MDYNQETLLLGQVASDVDGSAWGSLIFNILICLVGLIGLAATFDKAGKPALLFVPTFWSLPREFSPHDVDGPLDLLNQVVLRRLGRSTALFAQRLATSHTY